MHAFGWKLEYPILPSACLYGKNKKLSGGEYRLAKIHVDKAYKLKN